MHNHAGKVLKRDLKAARAAWIKEAENDQEREAREKSDFLAYKDSKGRYADFHSLRHSFVSRLVNSGANPNMAKKLARHSTITLTMDRYSHLELEEAAQGLRQMPSIPYQPLTVSGCPLVVHNFGSQRELERTEEKSTGLLIEAQGSEEPLESLTNNGKTVSSRKQAPIAQLDRASVYGTEGYRFESCWVYS